MGSSFRFPWVICLFLLLGCSGFRVYAEVDAVHVAIPAKDKQQGEVHAGILKHIQYATVRPFSNDSDRHRDQIDAANSESENKDERLGSLKKNKKAVRFLAAFFDFKIREANCRYVKAPQLSQGCIRLPFRAYLLFGVLRI